METTTKRTHATILLLLTAGCATSDVDPTEPQTRRDGIVGGEPTCQRPEIGMMKPMLGTGTLVAPNVVLTGAHVVYYETGAAGDWVFEINSRCEGTDRREVVEVRSFGGAIGDDDVALVRLDRPIDPSIATPVEVATETPDVGAPVTYFGFGCRRRTSNGHFLPPDGEKSTLSFEWGISESVLCGGDSGGPVLDESGAIFATNSYVAARQGANGSWVNHRDHFADVASWSWEIEQQIEEWWPPEGPSDPEPEAEACAELSSESECAESSGQCVWDVCALTCVDAGTERNGTCEEEGICQSLPGYEWEQCVPDEHGCLRWQFVASGSKPAECS